MHADHEDEGDMHEALPEAQEQRVEGWDVVTQIQELSRLKPRIDRYKENTPDLVAIDEDGDEMHPCDHILNIMKGVQGMLLKKYGHMMFLHGMQMGDKLLYPDPHGPSSHWEEEHE